MLGALARVCQSSSTIARSLLNQNGFGILAARPPRAAATHLPSVPPSAEYRASGAAASYEQFLRSCVQQDVAEMPGARFGPTVLDYHHAYVSGALTPVDVVEALLKHGMNSDAGRILHLVAEPCEELARRAATESAERYRCGKPLGPLDGVPVAVKVCWC